MGGNGLGAEIVAVADDDGGSDENEQAESDEELCFCAGAFPFLESDAPERAEDNDAGHVESPTGEFEAAHLRFAHGVKEKLKIPGGSCESGKEVIRKHRDACGGFFGCGIAGHEFGSEVLATGVIANVQDEAPYEICGEAAEEYNDENGQTLPENGSTVTKRDFLDGIASGEAESEAGAHDARKCRDEDSCF